MRIIQSLRKKVNDKFSQIACLRYYLNITILILFMVVNMDKDKDTYRNTFEEHKIVNFKRNIYKVPLKKTILIQVSDL